MSLKDGGWGIKSAARYRQVRLEPGRADPAEEHFEGERPVVMGGGLFSLFPICRGGAKAGLARAKMIRAEVPPVYGAAVEAMWDVGLEPDENFKKRFLESYNSFVVKSR